jgi:predicted aldo/keto reductase-like oxidoreductase
METRRLGRTGLEVSLLGFGGFHLLEIPALQAQELLNYYLDNGGNYIETAAEYGHGESERKISPVVEARRDEIVLASKVVKRGKKEAYKQVENSLERLGTDYLDILFFHHVENEEVLAEIMAPDGALAAAKELQQEGKVDHLGISMHGQPDVLIKAVKTDEFDLVMPTLNYFDKFNFPRLEDDLLPLAEEKDIGVVGMKALADGFLWRSAEEAFRYAFSLPVSIVVAGMNTKEMVKEDLAYAEEFAPMSTEDQEELFAEAPKLGTYICRQCDKCYSCPEGIDIKEVCKLEGYYDRQMRDGKVRNPEKFALRDRLRFWYGNDDLAQKLYQELEVTADACTECGECEEYCPYDLELVKKMRLAHYKLGADDKLF